MARVYVHKAYSFKEAKEFDIAFWRKAGAQARFSASWLMVGEWFKMRGRRGSQPRLRRTVQSIKRAQG